MIYGPNGKLRIRDVATSSSGSSGKSLKHTVGSSERKNLLINLRTANSQKRLMQISTQREIFSTRASGSAISLASGWSVRGTDTRPDSPDIWSFVGTIACCSKLQTAAAAPPTLPVSLPAPAGSPTQSQRHRDIILLAFCQPSCHIRFTLPRNKLTGANTAAADRRQRGAGTERGQTSQWSERMLPRSEELSGAHFMPHLTYIWATATATTTLRKIFNCRAIFQLLHFSRCLFPPAPLSLPFASCSPFLYFLLFLNYTPWALPNCCGIHVFIHLPPGCTVVQEREILPLKNFNKKNVCAIRYIKSI